MFCNTSHLATTVSVRGPMINSSFQLQISLHQRPELEIFTFLTCTRSKWLWNFKFNYSIPIQFFHQKLMLKPLPNLHNMFFPNQFLSFPQLSNELFKSLHQINDFLMLIDQDELSTKPLMSPYLRDKREREPVWITLWDNFPRPFF